MKNNKGFMLAEVVITSTVVLTSLVGLYVVFNKLYKNYNVRMTYYDIDGVFAAREMVNSLMGTKSLGDLLSRVSPEDKVKGTEEYAAIIKNEVCQEYGGDFCEALKDEYQIQNMYVIKYDKKALEDFKNDNVINIKNTFKDYIDYIVTYYNIKELVEEDDDFLDEEVDFNYSSELYNYLFVVEYKNSNKKYYYSSIRLG
ncbi:MAG: hypothetical protein VZS44_04035 [Bacilli bacterium]|nr:hypothetical protein [Bacilli bacterium]